MSEQMRLSEAERYIMAHFWNHGPMKTDKLSALVADKQWKPTTLLTFLSRLAEKGMLRVEKQGKANYYVPLVSMEEYSRQEGRALLDGLFQGSAKGFLAAMTAEKPLSADDITELKLWLEEQEANDG